MKLVVGLGNPGLEYRGTRHNAGFDAIDALSQRFGSGGRAARSKFQGLAEEIAIGDERVLLLKPLTYMNRSGLSAGEALRFHKLDPKQDLMVIVDDMSIPCGAVRLRGEGGSGGHQGLNDLQRAFGHNAYARCRIGIDGPGELDWSSYVLGRFRPEQRPLVDEGIRLAADAVECWVRDGLATCMNRFNRNERDEGESRRPSAKGASSAARPEGGNASPPAGPASA
jgi:PTH1 family peptidyl-tRNA hydrolase